MRNQNKKNLKFKKLKTYLNLKILTKSPSNKIPLHIKLLAFEVDPCWSGAFHKDHRKKAQPKHTQYWWWHEVCRKTRKYRAILGQELF